MVLIALVFLTVSVSDCHGTAHPAFGVPPGGGSPTIDGAAVTFTCHLKE